MYDSILKNLNKIIKNKYPTIKPRAVEVKAPVIRLNKLKPDAKVIDSIIKKEFLIKSKI